MDPLTNWVALNNALRDADEKTALTLLRRERKGKHRLAFLIRIYGTYNLLRARRERQEILLERAK